MVLGIVEPRAVASKMAVFARSRSAGNVGGDIPTTLPAGTFCKVPRRGQIARECCDEI
jgi:hypothetical protein